MTVDRMHKLAQAAQVGDLLAERAEQVLEELDTLEGGKFAVEYAHRLEQLRANLRRQVDAYRSVRT